MWPLVVVLGMTAACGGAAGKVAAALAAVAPLVAAVLVPAAALMVVPPVGVPMMGVPMMGVTTMTLGLPVSFVFLKVHGTDGLALATILLGGSYSLVPAVLWPAVARYCSADQLGTAYGLMTALQQTGACS